MVSDADPEPIEAPDDGPRDGPTTTHNITETGNVADPIDVLFRLEGQIRDIETEQEFYYFVVNETRKLVPYRQAVVAIKKPGGKFKITAVSSLASVERSSPFIVWLENLVSRLEDDAKLNEVQEFSLRGYSRPSEPEGESYPFLEALWVPFLSRREPVSAGMLVMRERPWDEQQLTICRRLGASFGHALFALRAWRSDLKTRWRLTRKTALFVALLLLVAMFVPVSLTTLAPVEVTAAKPQISAAPVNGVIKEIPVDPNSIVTIGDVLYRFDDTDFRNRYQIAEQNVQVASAKLRRAKQSVFKTPEEAHGIAILEAELARSQLERAYSKEQLDMIEVKATQSGIVLYSDRKDWIGKSVAVGERILSVADPDNVEFSVNVPVKDAIVLEVGARVKIYLDADPITPIDATLTTASYHAEEQAEQSLAYHATAQLTTTDAPPLRIGLRGTAKVYGETVPLFFYLFRRPISAARQYLGI